jgi:hypothetical protein
MTRTLPPEQVASIQGALHPEQLFIDAAEISAQNPRSLIVGSVGKAAVMGNPLSPMKESGIRRDIDVIRMGERPGGSVVDPTGYIDYLFENWISPDGSHLVFPHDPSLAVPVRHPDLLGIRRYWSHTLLEWAM